MLNQEEERDNKGKEGEGVEREEKENKTRKMKENKTGEKGKPRERVIIVNSYLLSGGFEVILHLDLHL